MDTVTNECPTDILIEIKEDKKCLSYINNNETQSILNVVKPRTKTMCSNTKKCISSFGSCPTEVLVDVPLRNEFCLCGTCEYGNIQQLKEDGGNEFSIEKMDRSSNYANSCKTSCSYNSSNSSENQSEVYVKRLRWRTPSPRSMSRISKEASKVIYHLNSSSIFDEDLLLTEELLPVTLNFDELEDDTNKENFNDDVFEDVNLNRESPSNVQFLNKIEKNDGSLNCCHSSKDTTEKVQSNLEHTFVERNLTKASFNVSSNNGNPSKGSQSSPCANSDSFIYSVEDDFNVTRIASEDKENAQMKINKLILPKKSETATKNLSMNKQKLDQKSTLRNVSNIKQEVSSKHHLISVNKNVTTPFKKMSISANKKENVPSMAKTQVKKCTSSVSSHYTLNIVSRPNSFQNGNELISSTRKLPTIKVDSGCSSLSSDVKQQNLLATPSRRYSLCPPLKSASAIKAPLIPGMTSFHNFAFPKYTPQPVRPSRLSFSSSWQHSGDNSQFFGAKERKAQISTPGVSRKPKVVSGIKNTSKPMQLSFSQSLSTVSAQSAGNNMSTSSKRRFSSKLNFPSPLTAEQNKKLARALFTSVS